MLTNCKLLLVLLAAVAPARAELPDFYKRVDRVFWVVDDLDRTLGGWRRAGIAEAAPGAQVRDGARWRVARLGDAIVDFIQPDEHDSVFRQFQKRCGQGVFALLHRVPAEAALQAEVARMQTLGVGILATGRVPDSDARYVLFDTAKDGKYVLGLIFAPPGEYSGSLAAPRAKPNSRRVSQYAFVVRDMPAVSHYWARLGWAEMPFTHPALWDLRYHGGPGEFDANLGWQKHGSVEYEWIQPTKGPTTYMDHMAKYGEGVHHIAFAVPDIEREEAAWSKAGFPTVQSGAWGERDRPGYGRYAYQDTHSIGGSDVELLWNYRQ
jgi:catechol 2,3-dioxygenase-like lactoylglutathione lyase family enzyme